jgi:integrase
VPRAKTRSRPGWGTVKQLESGRWQARKTIGYYPSGNPKRITESFETKAEAEDWLADQVQLARRGIKIDPRHITLEDFIPRWLEHLAATAKEKTVEIYRQVIAAHVLPKLGSVELRDLTPFQVQRWQAEALKGGTSAYTVRKAQAKLRQALNQAVAWELIVRNPAASVRFPKYETPEMPVLDADAVAAFLDHPAIVGHRFRALFHLALMAGFRPSELLGLRWQDVNLNLMELRVRQAATTTGKGSRMVLGATKTTAGRREVALSEVDVQLLRERRDIQAIERKDAGEAWQEHGLVFASMVGTPTSYRNFYRAFQALKKRTGLPADVVPYALRHTYGTLADAGGVDTKVYSERMGHTSVAFTQKQYVKTHRERRRLAALTPDELLSRSRAGGAVETASEERPATTLPHDAPSAGDPN